MELSDLREWLCTLPARLGPADRAVATPLVAKLGQQTTGLARPAQFTGYSGTASAPDAFVLNNNGLHIEVVIDAASQIGATDPAHIADVRLESAMSAIMDCEEPDVVELARDLQAKLTSEGSGLTVQRVAGGYQLVTRPEAYATVERLSQVTDRHLSAPTMETLSIIAFKQPITKPEIEQLRGVRVERALAKLLELDLICELGRKQVIGRPILYGTTATFLRCFGLDSLDDLPQLPTTEDEAESLDDE